MYKVYKTIITINKIITTKKYHFAIKGLKRAKYATEWHLKRGKITDSDEKNCWHWTTHRLRFISNEPLRISGYSIVHYYTLSWFHLCCFLSFVHALCNRYEPQTRNYRILVYFPCPNGVPNKVTQLARYSPVAWVKPSYMYLFMFTAKERYSYHNQLAVCIVFKVGIWFS